MLKPAQQHQASWAELLVLAQGQAGQVLVFRLYCNCFVSDFTLMSVSIYLFYLKIFKKERDAYAKSGVPEPVVSFVKMMGGKHMSPGM